MKCLKPSPFIFLSILLFSCKKNDPSQPNLSATLMSYTWQLVSSTNINESGNVSNRYLGISGDSVLFVYGPDQYSNVIPIFIKSYIGGTTSQYNFSESYNFTTKNDLLLLTPPWKTGYSNTVYCLHYDSEPLVLKMNYASGKGYEIDTLKIGRWH